MSNARESESGSIGFIWIWGLILIPLIYFLSIGPVLLMFKNRPNPPRNALRGFYYPVVLLHDHTFLKKPIEAYCDLWGVH
jgi:hypothetical protein